MNLTINLKDGKVDIIPSSQKDPLTQYIGGIWLPKETPIILATISGKNRRAKKVLPVLKIALYDMVSAKEIRLINSVTTIQPRDEKTIEPGTMGQYPIFKTNLTDSFGKRLFDAFWKHGPRNFAKALVLVEEFYTKNDAVNHAPILRAYFGNKNPAELSKSFITGE